jgi:hypothetical protein
MMIDWSHCGMMINRGAPKKNQLQCHFVHRESHKKSLGTERPVLNHLSYEKYRNRKTTDSEV